MLLQKHVKLYSKFCGIATDINWNKLFILKQLSSSNWLAWQPGNGPYQHRVDAGVEIDY